MNPVKLKKLKTAIDNSLERMKCFRENRKRRINYYAGDNYGDRDQSLPTPYNLVNTATQVISRMLSANNPNIICRTEVNELADSADSLEKALNYVVKEIHFADMMRLTVKEALLGVGIIKIGMKFARTEVIEDVEHDIGKPFVENVSLNNFVIDMDAKKMDQVQFMGDRFRVPLEDLKDSGLYDKTLVKKLKPTEMSTVEDGVEEFSQDPDGADNAVPTEQYIDTVELWEIVLPLERRVVTFAINNNVEQPIRDVEYMGPEDGTYRFLSFDDVPGAIIPMAPAANWEDGHALLNSNITKLKNQAKRQKDVNVAIGGQEETAKILNDSIDGDTVVVPQGSRIEPTKFGGIDQGNLAFTIYYDELMNKVVGNLSALAGWGAQADTATQEELVTSGALKQVSSMEDAVRMLSTVIMEGISWYIFYDPNYVAPITKSDPAGVINLPIDFSSDQIEGEFLEYNYEIEFHSMRPKSLAAKAKRLQEIVMGIYVPLMPLYQSQGLGVDLVELNDLMAEYEGIPELKKVIVSVDPAQQGEQVTMPQPSQSPVTQRTNIRKSVPGASDQGRNKVLMGALMNQQSQGAESASLLRPNA